MEDDERDAIANSQKKELLSALETAFQTQKLSILETKTETPEKIDD